MVVVVALRWGRKETGCIGPIGFYLEGHRGGHRKVYSSLNSWLGIVFYEIKCNFSCFMPAFYVARHLFFMIPLKQKA